MDLFKCETIAQFKIGVWLVEQGIERADIASVELLALDTVKIVGHGGAYMVIRWRDGDAGDPKHQTRRVGKESIPVLRGKSKEEFVLKNDAGKTALVLYHSGEPYTTSEIIAEGADVQHHTITRLIQQHKGDFMEFGRVRFEIEARKTRGGTQHVKVYCPNEQQAALLMTYLKNTARVRSFKKELVRQFYAMRSLLLEQSSPIWQETRSMGKEIRRQETDAIKRLVDYAAAQGSQHAARYYNHPV